MVRLHRRSGNLTNFCRQRPADTMSPLSRGDAAWRAPLFQLLKDLSDRRRYDNKTFRQWTDIPAAAALGVQRFAVHPISGLAPLFGWRPFVEVLVEVNVCSRGD